jgi:ADP-heptose:LPS heptosyltransferase
VLCHDSAPMHLAVALERPLVCLIGPTNPLRTGPYGRVGDVLRADLPCSPCYLRRLAQCPYDHRCMRDLDVATVVSVLQGSLKGLTQARDSVY